MSLITSSELLVRCRACAEHVRGGATLTVVFLCFLLFFFCFVFFVFLVDEGREDPHTTLSGPTSAQQQNAGRTLEKTICMNMNYNYLFTIFRSIFDPNVFVFLVLFTIFHFDLEKFISINCKYIFFYQKCVHYGRKYF